MNSHRTSRRLCANRVHRFASRDRHGLTLVELLVVILIIGILIAILLPAVVYARESARRTSCQNNLKQVGIGLLNYENTHKSFPMSMTTGPCAWSEVNAPVGWWSWRVAILPFVEEQSLYDSHNFQRDGFKYLGDYTELVSKKITVYVCPSDPNNKTFHATGWWQDPGRFDFEHSNYFGCAGNKRNTNLLYPNWDFPTICERHESPNRAPFRNNGMFPDVNDGRTAIVPDGLSNTIFVGERPVDKNGWFGWWAWGWGFDAMGLGDTVLDVFEGTPRGNLNDTTLAHALHFWSDHYQGSNYLYADGSVHFIDEAIDYDTFLSLGSADGGEMVDQRY